MGVGAVYDVYDRTSFRLEECAVIDRTYSGVGGPSGVGAPEIAGLDRPQTPSPNQTAVRDGGPDAK